MNLRSLLLRAACVALALGTLRVSAASTDDRLKLLEDRLAAVEKENSVLKKQLNFDAKGNPTVAIVGAQGKEPRLAIGGYLHLNGEVGSAADSRFPAANRFLMRKARLGVKGSLAESVDFAMQCDLGANSLSSTSAYRLQAADIVVVWKAHSLASVTVGQFKTPYGYEQIMSDTKTISIERALASDQLTIGRQAGAMVAGAFLNKNVSYGVAVTNGNSANNSFNDNDQFTYSGHVGAVAYKSEQIKVAFGAGAFSSRDTGTFTGRRTGQGVDAQFAFGGATLDAEWLNTRYDRDTGTDYDARGWSVMSSYMLVPNRWQAFARYETFDPSSVAGLDRTNLRTVGFNYFIKGDDLRLSLNYLIGNPPGAPKHQDRLIGRVQVIF